MFFVAQQTKEVLEQCLEQRLVFCMFNFCAIALSHLHTPFVWLACLLGELWQGWLWLLHPSHECVTHLVTQVLFLSSVKHESVTPSPALLGCELLKQGLPSTRHCHRAGKPL